MASVYFLISLLFIVTCYSGVVKGWEREIISALNPGCPDILCNGTYNVAYIKAKGPKDTLHYVWDLTKKPSMLLALTYHNASITFDWNNITSGGNHCISFSEKPIYLFGVVINRMWEFNDINDTGIFDQSNKSSSYVRLLHTDKFVWNRTLYDHQDSRSATIGVTSHQYVDDTIIKSGSLKIMVQGFGYQDHSRELPHLLHTPNTTQVDLIIDGLSTDPSFNSSRFAVELVMLGSDQANHNVQILERKSLDDEHSPGVFTLVDIETPDSIGRAQGGYLQWRPVAYVSPVRAIASTTDTHIYNPQNITKPFEDLKGTLILSAFSVNGSITAPLAQAANISFGLRKDGFYVKTNYTSWTFTVGYGKPPDEDFSLLVILVMSIGLGLPAVLIVVSGLVMLVRRVSRKKDDLFLGR